MSVIRAGARGPEPIPDPEETSATSEGGAAPAPAPSGGVSLARPGARVERGEGGGSPAALRAEAVAAGRATRKSDGKEGTEPILSPRHERRIERLTAGVAGTPAASRLEGMLARIGGSDAALGRALLLKAAGARADALLGRDAGARDAALETLDAFARTLDGMSAADMRARASVVDLDSRLNTSDFDPSGLDAEGSKIGRGGADDARADNDGLFQRFSATCGPTTLQILLCEEDPARAFAAHEAGLHSTATGDDDLVSSFQREVLEKYGGVAISRLAEHRFRKLKHEMGVLRRTGDVSKKDIDALGAYVRREGKLTRGAERALEAVRARADGFPSDADIAEIHAARLPRKDEGLGYPEFAKAIAEHLTPVTGIRYAQTPPPEGFSRGKAAKHLDAIEGALRRGVDVPVGMSEPGHWLLLSAVEGKAPGRRYLMSDPWTAVTAWVGEKDLVSGRFSKDPPFSLSKKDEKGYIDSFFLPLEGGDA